jgi:4-aminobutyrate aminotransferase-like enzyme
VVTGDDINRVCKERDFSFYTTHINDPLPAAVGDRVLEIVLRDGLFEESRKSGVVFHDGLQRLQSHYGCISDVRGRGLMAGVDILGDRKTKVPALELAKTIGDWVYGLGVWANLSSHLSFGGSFRIAPPITVTEAELEERLAVLEKAFAETEGSMPLY